MERDLAGLRLTETDFQRLAALCQGDPKFPADFKAWDALVRDGTRQALAEGMRVDDRTLDIDDFSRWCRRVAIQPCLDALRAYLIIGRRAGQRGDVAGGPSPGPSAPGGGRRGAASRKPPGALQRARAAWQRLVVASRLPLSA